MEDGLIWLPAAEDAASNKGSKTSKEPLPASFEDTSSRLQDPANNASWQGSEEDQQSALTEATGVPEMPLSAAAPETANSLPSTSNRPLQVPPLRQSQRE